MALPALPRLVLRALGDVAAELVAPLRCAACEERVAPRVLFCSACGVSVLPAGEQPPNQHSLFAYGGAVATAIVRSKYAGRSDLLSRFGDLMADVACDRLLARTERPPHLVVAVPLHPKRLVTRGYDQAALLAAPIARRLGVPCAPRAIVRFRETPPQASLDRDARANNVARAFRCKPRFTFTGLRVVLVDDVRTTGATLEACADALRTAGAADVVTFVLASRDRDESSPLIEERPHFGAVED